MAGPEKEVNLLQFERVNLSYGGQKILNNISFEIQDGQFAVFIGPSGCGKTTTLKMINRLIEPTSGKIYLDGEDIATKDKVEKMMDTIVKAFDKQLDALFGEEALDISTDITVMENLLAQEGLTEMTLDGDGDRHDINLEL